MPRLLCVTCFFHVHSKNQNQKWFARRVLPTYRLVESVRVAHKVKQHTVINLGKHFSVAPEHWPLLSARIEQLLNAQTDQLPLFDITEQTNEALEAHAQRYAALIIQKQSPTRSKSKH